MTCIPIRGGVVCIVPDYKPGDPPPTCYLEWHEWARVQHRAGLRQRRCPQCRKWRFPQEECCGAVGENGSEE